MSTVLINTSGKSEFKGGAEIAKFGNVNDDLIKKLGFELTNSDHRAVLEPNRKVIDVVNDFSWYAGPKATTEALNRVPCCFITEREQLLSSLISGGMYYLRAGTNAISDLVSDNEYIKSLLGKAAENKDSASGKIADTLSAVVQGINEITGTETDSKLLEQHNLKSLQGIYFTKPTGFHYRLPLYSAPQSTLNSGFDTDSAGQVGATLGNVVDKATTLGDDIAKAVNFAQPGVFIEKPKYFQGIDYRTETIEFPLSNTVRRGTVSPIQQNYELLWLLAFQNRPYKTTFARTPPPKIYSVSVPGQFSMPYSFISGMSVNFVGTVRKTKVTVPSGNGEGTIGSQEITTNVPEAYQVRLEFTSLIGEYGNTMISDAYNTFIDGDANKVTIGKAPRAEVVGPPPTTTR